MAFAEEDKLNEIPGTRHSYLKKVANIEVKLNEIPAGSGHAYLEELVSEEEDKLL